MKYIRSIFYFFLCIIYMETVYHLACFRTQSINPLIFISLGLFAAGLVVFLSGFLKRKGNGIIFLFFVIGMGILFATQLVYLNIFRQPLRIDLAINGGGDALTNYWREALNGIWKSLIWVLLLLLLPPVATVLLRKKKILDFQKLHIKQRISSVVIALTGLIVFVLILFTGSDQDSDLYEGYITFHNPSGTIGTYGVTAFAVRDVFSGAFDNYNEETFAWSTPVPSEKPNQNPSGNTPPQQTETEETAKTGETGETEKIGETEKAGETTPTEEQTVGTPTEQETETVTPQVVVDESPNVLPIDFEALKAQTSDKNIQSLIAKLQMMNPTNKNAHTGRFKGYNLIYLTAEGFSPYAVREELTPTLYKMIHTGYVFENYYAPLWFTSTSDGEYVNCTGLVPDQTLSFKRSSENRQAFSLPAFFALEGVKSYAYHNNSLSYYDRHRSHPNLGYNFKASKLGKCDAGTWGGQIFHMDNPGYWPNSDLEMIQYTLPDYINDERFHAYYMTVSGHLDYTFALNRMSRKHQEQVADLPYPEEGQAYIACHMELEAALTYLLEELEKAGKLENTVICFSTDHYPYEMDKELFQELAGEASIEGLELFRNNLVLWNSELETEIVTKEASALDIMPTLLNLFGFPYDSRLFAGRDIFSDASPLLVFSDRSFKTDRVTYFSSQKETTWKGEEDPEYFQRIQTEVKELFQYSAGILKYDFYRYVEQALPEEYRWKIDPEWIKPKPGS